MMSFAAAFLLALAPLECRADGPADSPDAWAPTRLDERKALPNNPAPPERTAPQCVLPPLQGGEQGVIRSVALPAGVNAVAFTFDMCELATVTTGCNMDIVNVLREMQVPATLFMGGKWMRTHAARVGQLMREPLFEIGSHAWSHGNFGIMGEASMHDQVLFTQAQYELIRADVLKAHPDAIIPPVPVLFRFPYGRCCGKALEIVAGHGLRAVQWSIVGEGGADNSRPEVAEDVLRRIRPGDIILLHANRVPKGTEVLVRRIATELKKRGWTMVTAGRLLEMGKPRVFREGYFVKPGDNLPLDAKFGIDGTGVRRTPAQAAAAGGH